MDTLRVMIVDDEYMAIEYLHDLISWTESGFEIVSEATDSITAISDFKKYRPQIVISDIRMPGVNGLDLCKEMVNIDNSVKVILLTAYSEFEYAKAAIEIGIKNYILKHEMNSSRLLEELKKVRKEILHEADTNKIVAKYVVMNKIGEYSDSGQTSKQQWQALEKYGKTFVLVLMKKDEPYSIFIKSSVAVMKEIDYESVLKELYLGLPDGYSYIDSFSTRNEILAILFSHRDYLSKNFLASTFRDVVVKTQHLFSTSMDMPCSAVIMMGRETLYNVSTMYRMSEKIFNYIPLLGNQKIIFATDFELKQETENDRVAVSNQLKKIKDCLNKLNFKMAINEIENLFNNVISPVQSPSLLRLCCDEMVKLIDDWFIGNFLSPIDRNSGTDCHTVADIRDYFINILKNSTAGLDPNIKKYSKKVYDAVQYLHSYYSNDISVSDAACALDISESNLSKSFKSETGKSILDYLTDIRIAASKRLLCNTNLKIYQISERVGYKTSQYFSQVFFKATNLHPLEYRDRGKGNQ